MLIASATVTGVDAALPPDLVYICAQICYREGRLLFCRPWDLIHYWAGACIGRRREETRGMSAGLVYLSVGAGLTIGVGIFMVSVLFLQTARRYVDLAERRLELLREGEAFLLKIVQRQGRALEESREREAERREWVPEMVGYPLGQQQVEESPEGEWSEGLDRHVRETPDLDKPPAENREQRRYRIPKTSEAASRPKDG